MEVLLESLLPVVINGNLRKVPGFASLFAISDHPGEKQWMLYEAEWDKQMAFHIVTTKMYMSVSLPISKA